MEKKYYDNEIHKEIKDKDNKDITYFYIEIDKNFDIYVYYYDVDLVSRPIENYNINNMSQYELLHSKSKVCKGLPYYFKSNMSHSDYYDTLIHGNQNNSYVNFSIITNVSGVTKTVPVTKQSLRVRDVKKFWLTKFKAVSFGSYEIPANKILGFNTNDINQIDSELSSNGCDSNDSSDSNTSNDTVSNSSTTSNITTNNHNVYDFFENRKKKYSNLFIGTTNTNVNNISLSGPSSSTSSININSISSNNDVSNNDYDTDNSHNIEVIPRKNKKVCKKKTLL